jgi:hypothetical protein
LNLPVASSHRDKRRTLHIRLRLWRHTPAQSIRLATCADTDDLLRTDELLPEGGFGVRLVPGQTHPIAA